MFILTRNNFSIFCNIFSLFHLAANRRGGGWKIHEDETTALGKNVTVAKYIARLERKLETKSVLCSLPVESRRATLQYIRAFLYSRNRAFPFLRSREMLRDGERAVKIDLCSKLCAQIVIYISWFLYATKLAENTILLNRRKGISILGR